MLKPSTKIWLNPFVSKTIQELYDEKYNGSYLVTKDLYHYYYTSNLRIDKIPKSDQHLLCKISYNKGLNIFCNLPNQSNSAYTTTIYDNNRGQEQTYVYSLDSKLDDVASAYFVESIDILNPNKNEDYFSITLKPSFCIDIAPVYIFAGEYCPICISV